MCRLFGLTAAPERIHATFWLVEAADSLAEQSRGEPDGTGVGTFDSKGKPRVDKQPLAAYLDAAFAAEAKNLESTTFVAHIRFATAGATNINNTHPFCQDGRLLAHNGAVGDLPRLEEELVDYRSLVQGDTDSERLFALITKHIDACGGDVGAGITSALRWVAGALPVYAVNLVVTTPTELWALRYPDTHDLLVLERRPGGPSGARHLDQASADSTIRVRSGHLASAAAVVVATEAMDEDPGWRPMESGELLHVDDHLRVRSEIILDRPPERLLTVDELGLAPRGGRRSGS
jgi:predicted glutamine amidotransferase